MLAFLFPGQGSQKVGMLSNFFAHSSVFVETIAEASSMVGFDLKDLIQNGPAEKLNQTRFAQVALLASEIGLWRFWLNEKRQRPDYLAGHSLGEYSALVASNALSFSDGIKLVAERGSYMQAAVPEGLGAMLAVVGLDEEKVFLLCKEAGKGQVLAPANFNSLGQVVLAGEKEAILRAETLAKEMGAKMAKILAVSVPSHCPLMKPAAAKLASYLEKININLPEIPVLHNVDANSYHDPKEIKAALISQLENPVQWVNIIQKMNILGVNEFVECGPGKVICGLNKRIIADQTCNCLEDWQNW
jgi:[acyl-carrier-protein] S-malonyltransferase